MSKKKLKLEALAVDSFSTKLSEAEQLQLNGGTTILCINVPTEIIILETIKESNITICPGDTLVDASPCPATPFQTKQGHNSCPGGQAC